jgi:hypothetical protein
MPQVASLQEDLEGALSEDVDVENRIVIINGKIENAQGILLDIYNQNVKLYEEVKQLKVCLTFTFLFPRLIV